MIPLVFLLMILLIEAIEAAVSYLISPSLPWYWSMIKPPLVPSPQIFRIVWTCVYASLGLAVYLSLKKRRQEAGHLLPWFFVLITLNAIWLWVLHKMHSFAGSLMLLIALVACTMVSAIKIKRLLPSAALLLIPFGLWLCFLIYLHSAMIMLNR